MRRSLLPGFVLAFAFVMASPTAAHALPPLTADTVVLDDGSTWRGKITELAPGDHVTVVRKNGAVMRLRWDAIRHIDRGGVRIPLPGPPVLVHLEASQDVALERFDPYTRERTLICYAPCDRELPSQLLYVVSGESIRGSRPFELRHEPTGAARLDVSTRSKTAFTTGIVALSLGGIVTIAGVFTELTSAGVAAWNESAAKDRATTGAYIMAGGVGVMALGGILMIANASSSVRQSGVPNRTPTWTKPVVPEEAPAEVDAPVIELRF
jgi:hypothetical protein